jgi:integrase
LALTATQIKTAKPRDKRYRLTDGGGLVLDVSPSGRKVWRLRYQRAGKDAVASLGDYPTLTLLDARDRALSLKRSQQAGHDPSLELKREAERNRAVSGDTFEALAVAFMAREKPHWAKAHHYRFENRMKLDVFPVLGAMNPRDIQAVDVSRAIAGIEGRGAQNTAVRVVGMVGQVLRYGVAKGLVDRDVTADLRGGLDRPARTVHRPAVLDRAELGQMLSEIWDWPGDSYAKPQLQLGAYLFQRPGEIRAMRWADVDLDRGLWTFTVTKVDVAHAVPLCPQAVAILRELHRVTGRYDRVFYSRGSGDGFASALLVSKLLEKLGYKGRHTAHGFRAVARTLIAEDLKIAPPLIEQQLSHGTQEALGRAYNRTLFLSERTDMMHRYAAHLDALRAAQA